jgi:hypothetical protein
MISITVEPVSYTAALIGCQVFAWIHGRSVGVEYATRKSQAQLLRELLVHFRATLPPGEITDMIVASVEIGIREGLKK